MAMAKERQPHGIGMPARKSWTLAATAAPKACTNEQWQVATSRCCGWHLIQLLMQVQNRSFLNKDVAVKSSFSDHDDVNVRV
jgi:hypothetical protein